MYSESGATKIEKGLKSQPVLPPFLQSSFSYILGRVKRLYLNWKTYWNILQGETINRLFITDPLFTDEKAFKGNHAKNYLQR